MTVLKSQSMFHLSAGDRWSEVGGPCVRGSSECFAGTPEFRAEAVAASLRRAGRPLSFKLAVRDSWEHANEKGLPLLGVIPAVIEQISPSRLHLCLWEATLIRIALSNKTAAARALQARNHGCKYRCGMQTESSWLHCEDWHDRTSITALHAGLTHLRQNPSLLLWDLCCCLSFLSTLRQIYCSGSCLTRCVPLLNGVA